jgi:transposase-like protein
MENGQRVFHRYSLAFKQKVVAEIERGELKIGDAQRIYDIRGNETIQSWIRKLGKNHLLNKVVRIEMKDEKERIKELEKQVKGLESALAQSHVKNIALESLIECAEEHYQTDLKKNFGGKELGRGRKKEQG